MPAHLTTSYSEVEDKRDVRSFLRHGLKGLFHLNQLYMKQIREVPIKRMRQHTEWLFRYYRIPSEVSCQSLYAKDIPFDLITPPEVHESRPVLLYFHGGGYTFGSRNTHRALASRIAVAADTLVVLPEYRLAPEHPFPAAIEDGFRIWEWLLESGYPPGHISLAGDSAGGGLCLALLQMLQQRGSEKPASVVCMSPWADLTASSDWYEKNSKHDLIVTPNVVRKMSDLYLNEQPVPKTDPLVSPVYGNYRGAPPVYIQVGSCEILLGDAYSLRDKILSDGAQVRLDIWDNMQHVWQLFADILPEGLQAIEKTAEWLKEHR